MEKIELITVSMFLIIASAIGFFYFSDPAITGAVVTDLEDEDKEIIAKYSINPSFRVNIDYDLNDYEKAINGLRDISRCFGNRNELKACVEIVNRSMPGYTFELNCDKGSERIFWDMVGFYQECVNSDDKNCLCKMDIDYAEEDIKKSMLGGEHLVEIKQDNGLVFELFGSDVNIKIEEKGSIGRKPYEYYIKYSDDMLDEIKIKFKIDGKDYELDEEEVYLYKFQTGESNNLKDEIEFVSYDNGNIEFFDGTKKQAILEQCNIKKDIYKFCMTNDDKKFYIYEDEKIELKSPTIKFAAYLEELPPPAVKIFNVYDRPKDDKALIVSWIKSIVEDIAKYDVYFVESGMDIFNKPLSEIDNLVDGNKLIKKSYSTINQEDVNGFIVPTNCEFIYDEKICLFTTNAEELWHSNYDGLTIFSKESLYFYDNNRYGVSFDLPNDNIKYDIAVVAVDNNGKKIDNVKDGQKIEPFKDSFSIDNMAIDSVNLVSNFDFNEDPVDNTLKTFIFTLNPPTDFKNIDGTATDDFADYVVYYTKEDIEETEILKKNLGDNIFKKVNAEGKPGNIYEVKINVGDDESIYLILLAEDENINLLKSFKVEELGLKPLKYSSRTGIWY